MVEHTISTGAAVWASYFVNGDASGLTPEERAVADAWLAAQAPWRPMDVRRDPDTGEADEPRFSRAFGSLTGWGAHGIEGGYLLDYLMERRT